MTMYKHPATREVATRQMKRFGGSHAYPAANACYITSAQKKLHPRPSSCGFSCFLAPDKDLTVGFECSFIPPVRACEPASESPASGQPIMFLALPAVKKKRPERQNLGKPSNLPNPPLLPALGNHACRRQKKTCYLLFLVDSKALSAYSPIPSLSAIICSYFKRRHKEGQTDGRWFEKVKENACLYRTPKCKASNVNDTKNVSWTFKQSCSSPSQQSSCSSWSASSVINLPYTKFKRIR